MAKRKTGKGYCMLCTGTLEYEEITEAGVGKTYRVTKPSGNVVVIPEYLFNFLFEIVAPAEEDTVSLDGEQGQPVPPKEKGDAREA